MRVVFSFYFRIANLRMTNRTGGVHRYPLTRVLVSFSVFGHILTHCAHSQHLLWLKVELSKSFHQVFLADLPYLSATETTFPIWTSCDQPARCLLRVSSALSGVMTISQANTDHISISLSHMFPSLSILSLQKNVLLSMVSCGYGVNVFLDVTVGYTNVRPCLTV